MDKRNWHIKQRVQGVEMRDADDQIEEMEHNFRKDGFSGVNFLLAPVSVTEDAPTSQSVKVNAATAWDKLGQRVFKGSTGTLFAFVNAAPVFSLISRLYLKYKRDQTNPRPNPAGGPNINYDLNDSFEIQKDDGVAAAVPVAPALRTDESIHLADVTVPGGGGVIVNAAIDTSVQQFNSTFPVRRLKDLNADIDDALVAAAGSSPAPSAANRVALLSDALPMLGFMGMNKIVTISGTVIDVEYVDTVDGTGVQPIRIRNKPINTALTLVAGGRDYAGPLANTWHYVYAIADSTGANPDDVIASLNAGPGFGGGGPTIVPLGYDLFRLIGCFLVQAAAILPFRQINGEFLYDDVSMTAAFPFGADPHVGVGPTAFATLSCAPYCVPEAERVILGARLQTAGGNNAAYTFRSLGGPAVAGRTIDFYDGANDVVGAVNSVGSDWEFRLHVDALQQVSWQRALGAVAQSVEVVVRGFVLDLKYD